MLAVARRGATARRRRCGDLSGDVRASARSVAEGRGWLLHGRRSVSQARMSEDLCEISELDNSQTNWKQPSVILVQPYLDMSPPYILSPLSPHAQERRVSRAGDDELRPVGSATGQSKM
eukprot:147486-Hanusia_phi.AAC.2